VSSPPIRVVLAEDDLFVREGVQHLIGAMDGLDVVDAVGDLPAAEQALEQLKPDVVVTDIELPPTSTDEGLRLAGTLRARRPDVGVVVLSQHADPKYARTLLEGGGARRAYLLKERVTDPGQLETAIRAVAGGGSYVDSLVVERLLDASAGQAATRIDALTPREVEVMSLIAQAKSNEAVARELNISRRAVERHVNAIFGRLAIAESSDVSRRVMAVLLYLEDRRSRAAGDGATPPSAAG
jgi:DNA-binding NarL/FixJ family response regulator